MPKYVRKPLIIEARQYIGTNAEDILVWYNSNPNKGNNFASITKNGIAIPTPSGIAIALLKDWVVLDETRFSVWKFGDFEKKHKLLMEVDGAAQLFDIPLEN